MAVLKNVELWFPRLTADRPEQYQNKGSRKWKVQLRTRDKTEANRWKTEFGFKITPEEDDEGKMFYRTTLSRRAFDPVEGSDGQLDDLEKPRQAPSVILGNGEALDPYSIGNGSVGDVAFSFFAREDGEKFRTLKTVAVRKLIKREVREDDDQIELSDDVEIIEESTDDEDNSLF
jgi:hypothetical protein